MTPRPTPGHPRAPGPRLLLYAMYELRRLDRAPEVRISMFSAALERRGPLERITGGRVSRLARTARWVLSGGPRRVAAVYVETSTSSALPWDLLFLALMRLLGKPVGIYFRDAYQLYRDLFPLTQRRQYLADLAWRVTMPMMRALATHRFAPTVGLAEVLGLGDVILLPPGTDPSQPDLGIGEADLVAAVVSVAPRSGFDLLFEAVEIARRTHSAARLRVVSAATDPSIAAGLPPWVEVVAAGRTGLAEVLRPARVCVMPVRWTPYEDLAIHVRLMDLLSFGKPIVATASRETRRIFEGTGAGLVVPDDPEALAGAIGRLLADETAALELAGRARSTAESSAWTWDARAATIREHLLDGKEDPAGEVASGRP